MTFGCIRVSVCDKVSRYESWALNVQKDVLNINSLR